MTNRQHNDLAKLMHETSLQMEIIPSGGGLFDNFWFEYSLYFPEIQEAFCRVGSLDFYNDGVHQLDHPYYCGVGDSLEEAWEDLCGKCNDLFSQLSASDNWTKTIDQFVDEIKQKHEL